MCFYFFFYAFLHVERWRISASNEVLQWQLHGRKGVAQGCEEQNRAAAETWRADRETQRRRKRHTVSVTVSVIQAIQVSCKDMYRTCVAEM